MTGDRVNTEEDCTSRSLPHSSEAPIYALRLTLGSLPRTREQHSECGKRQNTLVLGNNMETASVPGTAVSANEHVLRALQLNKDHQAAVKTQIEQLESKLVALNKLLVCVTPRIPVWGTDRAPRLLQKNMKKTTLSPN